MKIGYARTSTTEQVAGLEAQERALREHGVQHLFAERVSSVAKRAELERALQYCREGDVLMVTRLDRLARSVENLVVITRALADKGASLKVLDLGLDTSTPNGKLMLNLLGAIAQFERELMLERQREGIAKAKAAGRYKGRVPTARRKATDVVRLKAEGMTGVEIAAALGIGRASVFRILRDSRSG
jgi:DNA invertase Pin-like site-specific DNA recombinase